MSDRIALGVIRKPHGVRGEASVEPWTDSAERFSELANVTLVSPDEEETRDTVIESFRVHGGRILIKFFGIDTPEDLTALRGWTIEIPEAQARPLEQDEYFLHDMVGLRLVDAEGKDHGEVVDAYEGGGGILLKVKHRGGRYEVPFAAEICTEIDIPGKKIVVNLPEGLDDL